MDITIIHCVRWGYQPKAASLAARIEKSLGITPQLQPGNAGQFDVMVDGKLLIGKQSVGILRRLLGNSGFPDPDAVIAALKERSD